MYAFDFAPLFRSPAGFDRLARMAAGAVNRASEVTASWPPCDIERHSVTSDDGQRQDSWRIVLAVAGFAPGELSVEVSGETLTLRGSKTTVTGSPSPSPSPSSAAPAASPDVEVLHQGISRRDFVRRFQLADGVVVTGASLRDGLLTVSLLRQLPEQSLPKQIPIALESEATGLRPAGSPGETATTVPLEAVPEVPAA